MAEDGLARRFIEHDVKIDLNRDNIIRSTPDGGKVVMFNDEPGNFYSLAGETLPDEMAVQAGYDIEDIRLVVEEKKEMAEATRVRDAKYEEAREKIQAKRQRGLAKKKSSVSKTKAVGTEETEPNTLEGQTISEIMETNTLVDKRDENGGIEIHPNK